MTELPKKTIVATFAITQWDETVTHEPKAGEGGAKMARVVVRKTFSGPLEGTSVADVLTARGEGGAGYLASELVDGTLEGRRGTFVLQHGGIDDGGKQRAFGCVVAGSGTGQLRGLRGDVVYAHDENGARITLTYSLES
ncbi:DUF3224 domain-containing protein [Sandaracinus amylolyticus]|uniref:DUF3224 domain-containing protein n=1 Tax=Sandaracinus amylolyticus TaxID=927083 RepID=UPI001F2001AB|nr:DUF3224 domain-containing protein [Sandaracinus amylolyticus]UJR82115.1 Hypothetical protein I5071_41800 [Sandaracinus amylolyticus]